MSLPILALGFRPFFLLAAVFGVVLVPLWPWMLVGRVGLGTTLGPVGWHAHEMIFG